MNTGKLLVIEWKSGTSCWFSIICNKIFDKSHNITWILYNRHVILENEYENGVVMVREDVS